MDQLIEYLVGVIESSYQDLAHLVPCGSFLGLFDERPIKRTRPNPHTTTSQGLFEFDDSEVTCKRILTLTLQALNTGTPAPDVLRVVVDAVRSIHDGSAVLDMGFRSLFEIYQGRLAYHCANRFREKAGGSEFGDEYLVLTLLFELHRPRTWVAAVRVMSMVTKSAIGIIGGGGSEDLAKGTHAASLLEISGMTLLPEKVCREAIRQVWRLLLDSAATEAQMTNMLGSARRTRWQIRFEATMELFDCFVGRSQPHIGRPLVSYYTVAKELDPGGAVAENGMLGGSMQGIVDLCLKRKRRLGRILLPPDGSWPLISHASRAHTVKHVYDQPAYALVRDALTVEETERGPSANKYVADLLYQRAPTDEIFGAIRNHRIMKKKAMAAVASDSYVPQGGSNNIPTNGKDAASDSAEAEKREVAVLLLDAMTQRIQQVVEYIQRQCDFDSLLNERKLNENSDGTMVVPQRFKYWEYMNEVADQLYYFVLFDAIAFRNIHARLYALVFPPDSDLLSRQRGQRDNAYIWLLLQLYHIERVSAGPIRADLAGDEDMLDQLLQMYNEQQIVSKDAFYLRDLALQAAMSHQQDNIRDNQGVKFRHPRMAVAMPFAPVVFRLQREFGQQFKDERFELLEGRDVCSAMKTATVSMLRQNVVPNALYTFLVPAQEDVRQLQGAETTYQAGGNVATLVLDHINVGGKHRLLQLVYKMMLAHEQGPQFQIGSRQPSVRDGVSCVSPHIVDTVYRLLYNAPYSNELMMKEVLEKLRRCDKVMATGNARFSAATLRWLHTIYQLMNCRLLRFFKYYAHAAHLVHHLRHSLVHVTHRQLYGSLECFALCLVNLQHDVDFLQALLDPAYHGVPLTPHPSALLRPPQTRYSKPKHAWFECAMLARNAVTVISRIVHMRGLADAPGLVLEDCLDSLGAEQRAMVWAPAVLRYLPRAVRGYFGSNHAGSNHAGPNRAAASSSVSPNPPVAPAAVRQLLASAPGHLQLHLNAAPDTAAAAMLVQFYAERPRHPLLLLAVWESLRGADLGHSDVARVVALVRRVLLQFPASQMSSYTTTLVDYLAQDPDPNLALLDAFMFRLQFVRHEHVVFALTRGEHDLRGDARRLALVRFALLEAPGFVERLNEWHRLDFQGRYWADFGQWSKQEAYLARFPEFFEHEAMLGPLGAALDPPAALKLPIYYENGMVRLLPVLEFALGRLIEAEDRDLLRSVLDRLGILYRLHQVPLTTLMNTLFVYYDAPTLHDPAVARSLNLSLLDMTQQNFSAEFAAFVRGASDAVPEDSGYVRRMMVRISMAIARHLPDPPNDGLPEIHYREIPNPILLVLTECTVELLTWWCLHQAPLSAARLAPPLRVSSEPEIRAEERGRVLRANAWPLARLWFALAMEGDVPGALPAASFIHSTGVLANVLPDELMSFPFVRHLADIIRDPLLGPSSAPKQYFSFVEFSQQGSTGNTSTGGGGGGGGSGRAGGTLAAASVFSSFEQNRSRNMANAPNTYLTLLHSILHYGGVATFAALGETIHALVPTLSSDMQLLYVCSTVGPILYRLVEHGALYVRILADLLAIAGQVCAGWVGGSSSSPSGQGMSTKAVEQVVDFFCFVKDQFDPGRDAWRSVAPHILALPPLLRYQLQCIIDQ
ncbi:hypothetical protein GGF37_000400 [Kickxella alabastrina]|nr:hypothetical protein GGF37_000400 [Kickxella alabastrina]